MYKSNENNEISTIKVIELLEVCKITRIYVYKNKNLRLIWINVQSLKCTILCTSMKLATKIQTFVVTVNKDRRNLAKLIDKNQIPLILLLIINQ